LLKGRKEKIIELRKEGASIYSVSLKMSSQFYNAMNYEPKPEKRNAIRKTPTVANFCKSYPFASCRTIKVKALFSEVC